MNHVTYEAFGARGDGVTDDMAAICAAHQYANRNRLPVRAAADAHYYIGGSARTALIQTDTDWGNARFTIDDRAVEDRTVPLFRVTGRQEPFPLALSSLFRGQRNAGIAPGQDCYTVITDESRRRFIRRGLNVNAGTAQTDNFLLRADGEICHPLVWDFPRIDRATAYPVDSDTLHLRGGFFTTLANQEPSSYNYYARNIVICRSNTVLSDLSYFVEGEGDTGAPYAGFISIRCASHVTVQSCFFTPHKTYWTVGRASLPVPMGSYTVSITSATDVLIRDCRQRDILDRRYWGLAGSNFCKNITVEGCIFSRMDAHQGVHNYTIRRCTLGHQGLNAIGSGQLTVEDSVLYGSSLINLRPDYGSVWDGDVAVRNVIWHPTCGDEISPCLLGAMNDGQHDFGYPCRLPRSITLENVHVDDSHVPADYAGPCLICDYDRFSELSASGEPGDGSKPHPYLPCESLTLSNLTFASAKPWRVCENAALTPFVKITQS